MRPFLTIVFALAFSFHVFAAEKAVAVDHPALSRDLVDAMTAAFGFQAGFSNYLNAITAKFPELSMKADHEKESFNARYGSAFAQMDAILSGRGPGWLELKARMEQEAVAETVRQREMLTADKASKFLDEADGYAKGEMPLPVLSVLLSFQPAYSLRPEGEILDGFAGAFRTARTADSNETRWSLKHPLSWAREERKRSKAETFVSFNGHGNVRVSGILLPMEIRPTESFEEALQRRFQPESIEGLLPVGAHVSAVTMELFGKRHVGKQHLSFKQEREEDARLVIATNYYIPYQGKILELRCSVSGSDQDAERLRERFQRYQPLFRLIAESVQFD